MKRKIRKILAGLSLTSALFVFQACYGPPGDFGMANVSGTVVSPEGRPVPGIQIRVLEQTETPDFENKTTSNEEGRFYLYVPQNKSLKLQFEDVDGDANGTYATLTITVDTKSGATLHVPLKHPQ